MPYQNLLLDFTPPVATITLDRPNRRNALSVELMRELIGCLEEVAANGEIRAVILAAAGKVFCSGHDLGEMVGQDITRYRHIFDLCTDLMTRLQQIDRKSTRLNSSHIQKSRMPSSA